MKQTEETIKREGAELSAFAVSPQQLIKPPQGTWWGKKLINGKTHMTFTVPRSHGILQSIRGHRDSVRPIILSHTWWDYEKLRMIYSKLDTLRFWPFQTTIPGGVKKSSSGGYFSSTLLSKSIIQNSYYFKPLKIKLKTVTVSAHACRDSFILTHSDLIQEMLFYLSGLIFKPTNGGPTIQPRWES